MDLSTLADRIDAVAVDLDGTVLRPDASISERTLRAFRLCAERGVAAMIVTGRSPAAAERVRSALGFTGPQVYYNGAAVVDMPSGRILATTPVHADVVEFCLGAARGKDAHFHAFLPEGTLVFERERPELDYYRARTGLVGEPVDLAQIVKAQRDGGGHFLKCMFIAEPPVLAELQAAVSDRFGGAVYLSRSHATFLEILAPTVSKGNALKAAMELRGLDPARSIAFGDEENDIPLIEAAGFGVAMENAIGALKARAAAVAPSNEADGVAVFLERIFGF
jgi:Cof subfamily protein (haloacid dehalogenase superfamily)